MASREKRPLAPSKSKQKANNDGTLPSLDQKSRKTKAQTNTKHQLIAQEILDAVATSSQLPAKYNAALPRKKALTNLRLKPKLKASKSNIIKGKITKKAPIRTLRKTNVGTTRIVKAKKTKKVSEEGKLNEDNIIEPENNSNLAKSGIRSFENKINPLKNSLKNKKVKQPITSTEIHHNVEVPGKDIDYTGSAVTNVKNSPKTTKKVKISDKKTPNTATENSDHNSETEGKVTDNSAKNTKGCKTGVAKRNSNKEKDNIKGAGDTGIKDSINSLKNPKLKRNTSRDSDIHNAASKSAIVTDTKNAKLISDSKSLVDDTIDEVVASTAFGSESEKNAKKLKKGKKVMDKADRLSEVEIKKGTDSEETKNMSNESGRESENSLDSFKSTLPKTRNNSILTPRSLRNGKLRKSTEFGLSADSESNKQYKFNLDDPTGSDSCAGDSLMDVNRSDSNFCESNPDNSRGNMNSDKNQKSSDDTDNNDHELGNNNNDESSEAVGDVGPTLRSKTKAKTTDATNCPVNLDGKSPNDVKIDEVRLVVKGSGTEDDSKKAGIMEPTRKENILLNISDKPVSRRSSLNVEMKKSVGSFYCSEKSDNPKSQIDQMIENIKLNIAKAIESKIFGSDKSMVLNKNVEMSKTEEIVAPLSTESQKKNHDEKDDDKTLNNSKNDLKSESTENSVPKVADTAKEIEKLVMGGMEVSDTHLENQPKTSNDNIQADMVSNVTKVFKIENAENPENKCAILSTSINRKFDLGNCSSDLGSIEHNISSSDQDAFKGTLTNHTNMRNFPINFERSLPTDQKPDDLANSAAGSQESQEIVLAINSDGTSTDISKQIVIVDEKLSKDTDQSESNANEFTESDNSVPPALQQEKNVDLKNEHLSDNFESDDNRLVEMEGEENLDSSGKPVLLPETIQETINGVQQPDLAGGEEESPGNVLDDMKTVSKDSEIPDQQTNIPQQTEEAETLESISREVERLVAESESDNPMVPKSLEQSIEENDPAANSLSCNTSASVPNNKGTNENGSNNSNHQASMEISNMEADTNNFLDALDSSFTDSDILNMAPEIKEALASAETLQIEPVCSKDVPASDPKLTQETGNDAEIGSSDKPITSESQDQINCCHLDLKVQNTLVVSENIPVRSDLSPNNTESSSETPSQSEPYISQSKETMELRNSSSENISNRTESSDVSRDQDSMGRNALDENPECTEDSNRSIENNRYSTVSGETSLEKETNEREKTLHVTNEASDIDSGNCGDTMKKEVRSDNGDNMKQITAEEQTCILEENKRVLRTRDKQKKMESGRKSQDIFQISESIEKDIGNSKDSEGAEETKKLTSVGNVEASVLTEYRDGPESESRKQISPARSTTKEDVEKIEAINEELVEESSVSEPLIRTRRSREVKKRKDDQQTHNVPKPKRTKKDNKKTEQNKEETLLDNEVAKINENNQSLTEKYEKSFKADGNFRGFSEGGSKNIFGSGKTRKNDPDRSHSETDLDIVKLAMENVELSKKSSDIDATISEAIENQSRNSDAVSENDKKISEQDSKSPETLQKDMDETSTSSESSNNAALIPKILETPEDKEKKESILRLLGLESLEKAAERMSQKAKKEQYTGTLKTVIRVQKDKDKKRSRSPLKMVLKQGRGDGDGDSPEFYTIQKELGTSALGDSSSGANRKFSTNHRHSCDEDPEESSSKDRQSLVIPEKSSSFSIHPGRLCADVCCYCFGKFGSLDTPMHLAQMKSDERRKKILNIERHLTKDSCLCDACYRHVDRKANTSPTNLQSKPQRQHRQLMVSKCSAKDCRESARHHVKRRWLLKIKNGLQNQVNIDWESSQHTSMPFCVDHYSKIERFLTCALCKRRLARTHTHQLVAVETDELNDRLRQQGIPVPLSAGTFVCKLCRYFNQLQLKYKDIENMNANHKAFFKSYRKRILHYHDIEVLEIEEEDSSSHGQSTKDKEKRKKSKCGAGKSGSSKSVDSISISTSEKSTPEPNKMEGGNSETDNDSFVNRSSTIEKNGKESSSTCREVQILGAQDLIENLKKRKSVDMQAYSSSSSTSFGTANDLVGILAMDKEVTLTRLPKKARTQNDINPVVQRLGANPSISVRTLFPGEEEMNLHANVEFNNVREVTPQGWEKCATMIQYDRDTKLLWQELQRPYGNQSSFLRHLILLEKYYRSGDLVLAPNASRNAINYSTSVQNRLISYEGPEKIDEPILEPIASEYTNPRRLSGGFVMERDRLSIPGTSALPKNTSIAPHVSGQLSNSTKTSPPRVLKLNSGVSIIKKPPPQLHRLSLPSTSRANLNSMKRTDNRGPTMSGGKVFERWEPDFKSLQILKKQKQMQNDKQALSTGLGNSSGSVSPSSPQNRQPTQYQKAQIAAQTQFQKHLMAQQEMLNRQSRSDFEPLICDVRSLVNENNPTQTLLNNLNLPRSIQVTTKPSNTIPIMPKIPKSLTVIPQTITRPTENK